MMMMMMEGVLLIKASVSSTPLLDPSPNTQEASYHQASPLPPPICVPPPPPVPPHPPPPPPLPPPLASLCVQRRSMKKVNWDAIPCQIVLGKRNVFTSQLPKKNLELDIQTMEELFSHDPQRKTGFLGSKSFKSMPCLAQEAQMSILDFKKSMNIGIFLKHFKRPVREMVEDIRQGNWLRFGAGKLKELCKLLPEDREVKRMLSFNGDLSLLPEADQLMVQLVKVPGYEERLKTMMVREEFFPLMEEMKNAVVVLIKAANELLDCDDLHSIIRLVLKAGNYMNAGGYAGNATGFRMVSLLKLADTKANKPGMNLLHYVAKQVQDIDAELLTFPSQLEHIGMASKIQKEEVKTDFQGEVQKIKEVRMCGRRLPDLLQQMETFITRAEAKLADMESFLQELDSLSHAVAEFFCENPAVFKLEECCSIFHSFCKKFDMAVQENQAREAAELRCKQRESFRISVKQDSTCSRLKPHPDPKASSLESVLHSFLSTHPGGLARCRGSILPQIAGSPTDSNPQTNPLAEEPELGPESRPGRSPEKKEPKMQKEGEKPAFKNDEEAEKMRMVIRKVQCYQNSKGSLSGDASDSPHQPEIGEAIHASPATRCSRTRYLALFNSKGNLGSPWTILSPCASPRGNRPLRNRHTTHHRHSTSSCGNDLADEVWLQSPATSPRMALLGDDDDDDDDDDGGGDGHIPSS